MHRATRSVPQSPLFGCNPGEDDPSVIDIVAEAPAYARLPDLHALMAEVYATSDGMSDTFAERYPNAAALSDELAAIRRLPGALFLVAESGGLPCGYLSIRPRGAARLRHTADLQMGVGSAQRHRGLGRRLVADALDRLAARGIVEIVYLMVRADNGAAVGLYAAAGFERLATLGRDTRIGDRYFDGVLMRRFVGVPAGGDDA